MAATKSKNPNLAFGVTIYEECSNHTSLMPSAVGAAEISYVHLYEHFREDAPNCAANVATAKSAFSQRQDYCRGLSVRPDQLHSLCLSDHCPMHSRARAVLLPGAVAKPTGECELGNGHGFGVLPWLFRRSTGLERLDDAASLLNFQTFAVYSNTNTLQSITLQVLKSTASSTGAQAAATGASFTLSPTSLSFGGQKEDVQSSFQRVLVTNTSSSTTVSFGTINYVGDFNTTNNCPDNLVAGNSCVIWVTFTPRELGTRTGSVTVHLNANGVALAPQTVTVGTGTNEQGPGAASRMDLQAGAMNLLLLEQGL